MPIPWRYRPTHDRPPVVITTRPSPAIKVAQDGVVRTEARKTPDGAEVALVLRHVVKAIRGRWPRVEILVRGDSHYGRPEALTWCEHNRVGYVFGLTGSPATRSC